MAGRPPYDPDGAVRVICWFHVDDHVVIALVGFDKKAIGDVCYASAEHAERR